MPPYSYAMRANYFGGSDALINHLAPPPLLLLFMIILSSLLHLSCGDYGSIVIRRIRRYTVAGCAMGRPRTFLPGFHTCCLDTDCSHHMQARPGPMVFEMMPATQGRGCVFVR